MANPLAIATKGKGVFATLERAGAIGCRYGLTSAKMDHALAQLAGVLHDFDCRATLPVTATVLSRNQAIAQKYQALGLELAVHGLNHEDYTQLSLKEQSEAFKRSRKIFNHVGIHHAGFRCPYLRWNEDTLHAISESGFEYDSSQALFWEVAGEAVTDACRRGLDFYNAQMASDYPALPRLAGNLLRIPYCLPDDEALVERLKLSPGPAMSEIWLAMLERIYFTGELFTLGIHPERVPLLKDALRTVLAKARSLSPAVWIARLNEIAAWYRSLGQSAFETYPLTSGGTRVVVHAPAEAALLARSVVVQAPINAWAQGFEQVLSREFVIGGKQRPWIGIAPDCPDSLHSFLQHLGYLVEISDNPADFSYYLLQKTFRPEDERPVLTELETESRPLLRLGRWPGGARAALAVTGDVDAFTLWDYAVRFANK